MDTQAINTNDPSCNMKKSADLHAADEIENNTQEKQNKQKLDNWDKFINLLGNWNRPENQKTVLNRRYVFSLDALPVSDCAGLRDYEYPTGPELNMALRDLTDVIWKEGGFRFELHEIRSRCLTHHYLCPRELKIVKARESAMEAGKPQESQSMTQCHCEGRLTIKPCLLDRTILLSIRHKRHTPCEDNQTPSTVQESTYSHESNETASENREEISSDDSSDWKTEHRQNVQEDISVQEKGKKVVGQFENLIEVVRDAQKGGDREFIEWFANTDAMRSLRVFVKEAEHFQNYRGASWKEYKSPDVKYLM